MRDKVPRWLRVVTVGIIVIVSVLVAVVLLIGFMLFNGRLVYDVVPIVTSAPIQPKLFVDSRSPKEKTRIPDTRLRCTPNPAGLTFTAQVELQNTASKPPISETIQLAGKGFTPDETLNIFLKSASQNGLYSLAFNEQVRSDGTFSRIEQVEWDSPQAAWQAFVVHQRGTACSQFLGN